MAGSVKAESWAPGAGSDWHTPLSRWLEMLAVYPRTNKQNQKKKRKVEPPTPQVRAPEGVMSGLRRLSAVCALCFLLMVCGLRSAHSSLSHRTGPHRDKGTCGRWIQEVSSPQVGGMRQ